jgi:hypothetical protein
LQILFPYKGKDLWKGSITPPLEIHLGILSHTNQYTLSTALKNAYRVRKCLFYKFQRLTALQKNEPKFVILQSAKKQVPSDQGPMT